MVILLIIPQFIPKLFLLLVFILFPLLEQGLFRNHLLIHFKHILGHLLFSFVCIFKLFFLTLLLPFFIFLVYIHVGVFFVIPIHFLTYLLFGSSILKKYDTVSILSVWPVFIWYDQICSVAKNEVWLPNLVYTCFTLQ